MENTLLTLAGLVMSFYAWRIALKPVVIDRFSALMTTLALGVTAGCYLSLDLKTAFLSVSTSAIAWGLITWKASDA